MHIPVVFEELNDRLNLYNVSPLLRNISKEYIFDNDFASYPYILCKKMNVYK